MYFLSASHIIRLHDEIIEDSGGTKGIRYSGLIFQCTEKQGMKIFGYEPYKDIFEKAAALMHCIVFLKPFIDGNKRTGVTAALTFLEMNGIVIELDVEESIQFTLKVARGEVSIKEIADWLRKNVRPTHYIA